MTMTTRMLAGLLAAIAALFAMAPAARAQAIDSLTTSYITPFPEGEKYRIYVFGDSYADGIWAGLMPAFTQAALAEVTNRGEEVHGLARNDGTTWHEIVAAIPQAEPFQVAVVIFGVNDRINMRVEKKAVAFGSDPWREEYARRVDLFVKALKRRGVAIYWLGLPIMRGANASADAEMMNTIYREKVLLNGGRFIESWSLFADAAGNYAPYGPDMSGKVQQLRLDNGIHMTLRGYAKLAHSAEKEIRRDLAVARAERDVPLAGDDVEQQTIIKEIVASSAATGGTADGAGGAATAPVTAALPDVAADTTTILLPAAIAGSGTAAVKIEIIRPSIPGAVLAHIRGSRQSRVTDLGQTVPADLQGGLTAMSSIANGSEASGSGAKAAVPLTQSPYYKVLVKGDPLAPKPGRADDFTWPRAGEKPAG